MILIALGGNLPSVKFGPPANTLRTALMTLCEGPTELVRLSSWYETDPVPVSDQPKYCNAVAQVETTLTPDELLRRMHEVEAMFGRVRTERNAARAIDLDLLDYRGQIQAPASGGLVLPHPRLHERAFVLVPLCEIAPDWRHPVLGESAGALIAGLPRPLGIRPL